MTDKEITVVTRRNLFDELRLAEVNWAGRLGEVEFLSRIFDLSSLPSHDDRVADMAGDVFMHRVNFHDWENDWVYDDGRLDLKHTGDEVLLTFLCEMVHPLVRSDEAEVQSLVQVINRHLAGDNYEIAPQTYISGKPIFAARARLAPIGFNTSAAKSIANDLLSEHVSAQVNRMETSVVTDPANAIGAAKDFVETICKGILSERTIPLKGNEDIPKLVKMTRQEIGLSVNGIADPTVVKTLGALSTLTHGIAELRGILGVGHGPHPNAPMPTRELASLAVRSSIALGVYLYEVHRIQRHSS